VHLRGGSGTVESRRAETPCSGGTRWRGCIDASPSDRSLRALFNFQPPTPHLPLPNSRAWNSKFGTLELEVGSFEVEQSVNSRPLQPSNSQGLAAWELEVGSLVVDIVCQLALRAARLQRVEQAADFVFLLQRIEPAVHVVGHQLRLRLADGLAAHHLALHAIESGGGARPGHHELRVVRALERARAAVLRDEHVALLARFDELLLELLERPAQGVDLLLLVRDLLRVAFRHLREALITLERGPCEVVLRLVDRELGLAHPVGRLVSLLR